MKTIYRVPLTLAVGLIITGCVSRKEIVQFKRSLANIEEKQGRLEERSARLDSLLYAYGQLLQSMKAEAGIYSDQIQQRLDNLEAGLEDLSTLYSQSYSKGSQKKTMPGSLSGDTTIQFQIDPKKL